MRQPVRPIVKNLVESYHADTRGTVTVPAIFSRLEVDLLNAIGLLF